MPNLLLMLIAVGLWSGCGLWYEDNPTDRPKGLKDSR